MYNQENKSYPRFEMPSVEIRDEAVLRQLERVLKSPGFARNERRSRFLRFLVERHLAGRDDELKESVIGTEVFGRKPDYNPKEDAIVRAEARRLRALLDDYYSRAGKEDALIIELPKGGYVPVIRRFEPKPDLRTTSRWRLRMFSAGLAVFVVTALALIWTRGIVNGSRSKPAGLRRSPAYGLYLRARSAYHPGHENPDSDVGTYQEIIAKDPTFAPGYAGLATAYASASSRPIGVGKFNLMDMRAAAERAIQLDSSLPEAYSAMGVAYARLGQWPQAEPSFRRAIELDPRAPTARLDRVMSLAMPLGWISFALQQVKIAEKFDPLSRDVQDVYAYVLISASEFDQAEEHCRRSTRPADCLGRVRTDQGRFDEAIEILSAPGIGSDGRGSLGYAYGRSGRRREAEKFAATSPNTLQQVLIYAGLRDKDRTLQALERMADLGPVRLGRTLTWPELAFLRGDPRLKVLCKKVGLPAPTR